MPCLISHTESCVQPPADCVFHHGVPWSISIASGIPQLVKAVSSRSCTASARVEPRPSSAIRVTAGVVEHTQRADRLVPALGALEIHLPELVGLFAREP